MAKPIEIPPGALREGGPGDTQAGTFAEDALTVCATSQRCFDDLLHKKIRIYGCDEEKPEGRQLHKRLYGAGERGIKKRDTHHRRANNEKLTFQKSGMKSPLAALKLLCTHNKKPFDSRAFGNERAESTGYYLQEFGPESAE